MTDWNREYVWAGGYANGIQDAIEAIKTCYVTTGAGEILRQGGSWENALDRAIIAVQALVEDIG